MSPWLYNCILMEFVEEVMTGSVRGGRGAKLENRREWRARVL